MFALGLVLSLGIGVSLGLLGGGGSILTVPVLHYVFAVPAHDAIAMSLVVVGTTSTVALIPHALAGRVHWRLGLAFGVSSMTAAYVGGRIGAGIPSAILIVAFALLMLVAGGAMLMRARSRLAVAEATEISLARVLASGLGVGLITGVLGAGGGFVIVPVLTLLGGVAIREAVGTSLLVIAMNSFAGLAGTASHARIDTRIILPVVAIAVVGSLVGARLVRRISTQHLQGSFGWFVIVVGVSILARELF